MKTAIEYADEDDLDIYTIGNFTEYKTLDDMNKNYTNENSNIIIDKNRKEVSNNIQHKVYI